MASSMHSFIILIGHIVWSPDRFPSCQLKKSQLRCFSKLFGSQSKLPFESVQNIGEQVQMQSAIVNNFGAPLYLKAEALAKL